MTMAQASHSRSRSHLKLDLYYDFYGRCTEMAQRAARYTYWQLMVPKDSLQKNFTAGSPASRHLQLHHSCIARLLLKIVRRARRDSDWPKQKGSMQMNKLQWKYEKCLSNFTLDFLRHWSVQMLCLKWIGWTVDEKGQSQTPDGSLPLLDV